MFNFLQGSNQKKNEVKKITRGQGDHYTTG